MAWTVRRPPWAVLAIPLAWSVIGTSAAGTLHVPEDWGLPFAAAAVLVLRLRPQRRGRMDRLAGVTAK